MGTLSIQKPRGDYRHTAELVTRPRCSSFPEVITGIRLGDRKNSGKEPRCEGMGERYVQWRLLRKRARGLKEFHSLLLEKEEFLKSKKFKEASFTAKMIALSEATHPIYSFFRLSLELENKGESFSDFSCANLPPEGLRKEFDELLDRTNAAREKAISSDIRDWMRCLDGKLKREEARIEGRIKALKSMILSEKRSIPASEDKTTKYDAQKRIIKHCVEISRLELSLKNFKERIRQRLELASSLLPPPPRDTIA